ncbi:MAG: RNA 2',3'-cyclic phosphodiesterase [Azospirillaceae bacterium]|nr:RNA 2',3'-cyclic phosphodiesterase [Azospirillaceae bacterium]
MIRLFVALALPEAIRAHLAGLGGGVPGASWTPPDNFHLTLRFVGDVDQGVAAEIDTALTTVEAPGWVFWLEGVGHFGNGAKPRVLWAGVRPNPALDHLHLKIESALVRVGLAPEARRYAPHITLARLHNPDADRVGRFLGERALFQAGPIAADRFTLFESCNGRHGPIYRPLQDYPLTNPPPAV